MTKTLETMGELVFIVSFNKQMPCFPTVPPTELNNTGVESGDVDLTGTG